MRKRATNHLKKVLYLLSSAAAEHVFSLGIMELIHRLTLDFVSIMGCSLKKRVTYPYLLLL